MTVADEPLLLRAAREVITPTRPGRLAGYAARGDAVSTGMHDDLEANLVWLSTSNTPGVAWLTLDALGVTASLRRRLAGAVSDVLGPSAPAVVMCASHTHSAPLAWVNARAPDEPTKPDGPDDGYDEKAVAELTDAVRRLASRASRGAPTPVTARWGSGRATGAGTNRLSPDGPHDDTVGVLSLWNDGDGERDQQPAMPLAVLYDYASHPTVLDPGNLAWSADWPGATRAVVRAALGTAGGFGGAPRHEIPLAFLQGAAGDVSARFVRRSAGFAEAARIGSVVGAAVIAAVHGGEPVPVEAPRMVRGTLELAVRSVPEVTTARAAVEAAERAVRSAPADPNDPRTRLAQTRLDGARVQLGLASAALPERMELPLCVVRLGPIAWAHVPVELFASLGLTIKECSLAPVTRVVGYTDGYVGYLADDTAHVGGSYEALSSYFDPQESARVVPALLSLIRRSMEPDHQQGGTHP